MRRFVFAAFALTVLAACQPATTELTDYQKAEIAAEVELLEGQFWDVWRRMDVEAGMSYYYNSPELSFAWDGQVLVGWTSGYDASEANSAIFVSQTINFTDSWTTVLAPDVVLVTQHGTRAWTDPDGVTSPELTFAWTSVWVRRDGEWKVHGAHASHVAQEGP